MVAHAGHSMPGMPTFNMCNVAYSTYTSQWFTTAMDGKQHDTVWNTSSSVSGDCVVTGFTPPPGTTHTPKIRMQIGSYGVDATGPGVYPTNYLNFGKTAVFPMDLFGTFSAAPAGNFDAAIICSVSGEFFDQPDFGNYINFFIAPAVTADNYDSNGTTTYLGNTWYDYAVSEDVVPGNDFISCTNPAGVDMSLSYRTKEDGIQDTTNRFTWLSLGLVLYDQNNLPLYQLEHTGRSYQNPDPVMALSVPYLRTWPALPYPCTSRHNGITGYPSVPWPF
jgi:hypothetical protein